MWEYKQAETNNELKHYGVLGMKWGVRRAALKNDNVRALRKQYQKDGRATQRAIRKSNNTLVGKKRRAAAEADMFSKLDKEKASEKKYKTAYNKAKADAVSKLEAKGYDKKTAARVANMSAGEAVLQTMLFGSSYGALKYNQSKAYGASTGKAIITGLANTAVNSYTAGIKSLIDRSIIKNQSSAKQTPLTPDTKKASR